MQWLVNAVEEIVGLVVEDGFVAVGAAIAIAVGYVLTRDSVIGPEPIVGAIIFLLLAGALLASLVRAGRKAAGRS